MGMPEKINRNPYPRWLVPWLRTPFYDDRFGCKKHGNKYMSVFCGVCMGKPYCKICLEEESRSHKYHQPILQACKASHRAAIELEKIKELVDVSGIQVYTINGKSILHLNPIKSKAPRGDNKKICQDPKCQTCGRKLKTSQYCFCSIACKYSTGLNGGTLQTKASVHHMEIEQTNVFNLKIRPTTPPLFARRRARKGIPRRAAFKS